MESSRPSAALATAASASALRHRYHMGASCLLDWSRRVGPFAKMNRAVWWAWWTIFDLAWGALNVIFGYINLVNHRWTWIVSASAAVFLAVLAEFNRRRAYKCLEPTLT